jgi:2-oxoglutarate dehydrogenase complex dehydrogenase (E1) component-like enzyme
MTPKSLLRLPEATSSLEELATGRFHRILPDMGVKVSFLSERPASNAAASRPRLTLPKAAVRSADGRSVVFVMHDDRVERRAVSVGSTIGDQTEVLSGVSAGERVIVEGLLRAIPGQKVDPQTQTAAK